MSNNLKVIKIQVKSWTNTDKFRCPDCKKILAMPDYTCNSCNIKIQPTINMIFK